MGFAEGMKRHYSMLNWRELTGLNTLQEVFKLFEPNMETVEYLELFPEEAWWRNTNVEGGGSKKRPNTPEFWEVWCRENAKPDTKTRTAKWEPQDSDDKIRLKTDISRQYDRGH